MLTRQDDCPYIFSRLTDEGAPFSPEEFEFKMMRHLLMHFAFTIVEVCEYLHWEFLHTHESVHLLARD